MFNPVNAIQALGDTLDIEFDEDPSSESISKLMGELKFLSTDSSKSKVPEEIAEYRRNLESLLLLPERGYICDFYDMKDAITEL